MIRLLLLAAATLQAEEPRKLTILHSNDLHARLLPDDRNMGGWAQLLTLVRRERAGCDHCLYLNAGDLVQGTPVSTLFKGLPLYELGNLFEFDASCLGNHEFDYGWSQVREFIKAAKFPVISANIVNGEGKLIAPKPYVIKKVNGLRVGIVGVAMGNLVEGFLTPKTAGPWHALPVVETVRKYVAELHGKTDAIIVLGHILQEEGSAIIREVPEVAAVIEGHNHSGREAAEIVDGRVAAGCRGYGRDLCRLDLEIAGGKAVSAKWTKIPVTAKDIAPAEDMRKKIAEWEAKVAKVVDVKIAEAERDFDQPAVRRLTEQAIRDEMRVDIGYVNSGGIRDRLAKGAVLARNVWNIIPFDNQMMTATARGSKLTKLVPEGVQLDPGREYSVGMSDFVVFNAGSRLALGLDGIEFSRTDFDMRDLLLSWIKKQGVLK